jgi:hypothetical protein
MSDAMEQRLICVFFEREGLSGDLQRINSLLGADAIAYSTVTLRLPQRLFLTISVDPFPMIHS